MGLWPNFQELAKAPIFGNVGKISAWHKMRDDMHARETGSKTVIKIHKGPAI